MATDQTSHPYGSKSVILFIFLPLILGILVSLLIPQPVIGIIEIDGPIDNTSREKLVEQIQYAIRKPEIKGVVLAIDSPGGTINDTELVFLELNYLRQKKPVVSMIQGLAASGAYYASMATDFIFSNPSAMVGNVGVIGQLPPSPLILEEVYSTGPYKIWGSAKDDYVRQIDMMKQSFLEVVKTGRGDKLKISFENISRGEIYPANEAMRLGMIDDLGSLSEAIDHIANAARIHHYRVIYLEKAVKAAEEQAKQSFYALDENGESTGYPKEPGLYYLYIPDIKGVLQ